MMTRSLIRVAAIGAAASLVLTACSDADDDDAVTSTASTMATSSAEEETSEAESESKAPEDPDGDDRADGAKASNPESKGESAPTNLDGNRPAVPERQSQDRSVESDEADVRAVVEGIRANSSSYAQYMRYLRANSCQKDAQALGDPAELEKFSESMTAAGLGYVPKLNKINSVQINGDRASVNVDATVTGGANGQSVPQAGDMQLLHEDGRWKFCGA